MTVSVTFDKSITALEVGDIAEATIKINGVPITGGNIQWANDSPGVVLCSPVSAITAPGQVAQIKALKVGRVDLFCIVNGQLSQKITVVTVAATAKVPRVRDWLQLWLTDFFYTWTPELEAAAAKYYDGMISGDPRRHERMKLINPKLLFMPYTLEYTVITNGNNLGSGYLPILAAWAAQQGLSAGQIEMMFLKDVTGKRLVVNIWGSNRNVGDPTNPNWVKFQVWRYQQLVAQSPAITGVFIDEFGSSAVNANFKLGTGGLASRLGQIEDAETALIGAIAGAISPKKLVVNIGAYMFQSDQDIAHAAKGIHTEQLNNPMNLDWWASSWTFVDKMLASGVLVNFVCAYGFGEYEGTKDGAGVHMDTHRGKLLELCGYYMLVTDPAQMALHLENGWAKPPMYYKFPEVDVDIGRALEPRVKTLGTFTRRFERGLVIVHPVIDRLSPDYGTQFSVQLPTDRKYGLVGADGKVEPQVKSIELRRPEAAIFKVIP